MKEKNYRHTMFACFWGYIVQAIINIFMPLLFVHFRAEYELSLADLSFLIGLNFFVQLCVDMGAAVFVDKLGTRRSVVGAHIFCALGLAAMTALPDILPPFAGLAVAVVLYAIGGGLLEVLVSPIVEYCPTDNKEKAMSVLHSFYCWGTVGVIALSTAYFAVFGVSGWRYLAAFWAVVPIINGIAFTRVPIAESPAEKGEGMKTRELFKSGAFRRMFVMMICAGASEQAVSQWASAFCEGTLGVEKSLGDLLGTAMFAVFMGTARALYGRFADRLPLERALTASSMLCVGAYVLISLIPNVVVGMLGIALCGFSVGIMWPGTFSASAKALPNGGNTMFALLALGGDIGCSAGPQLSGFAAQLLGGDLRLGVLCAIIFPACLAVLGFMILIRKGRSGC